MGYLVERGDGTWSWGGGYWPPETYYSTDCRWGGESVVLNENGEAKRLKKMHRYWERYKSVSTLYSERVFGLVVLPASETKVQEMPGTIKVWATRDIYDAESRVARKVFSLKARNSLRVRIYRWFKKRTFKRRKKRIEALTSFDYYVGNGWRKHAKNRK